MKSMSSINLHGELLTTKLGELSNINTAVHVQGNKLNTNSEIVVIKVQHKQPEQFSLYFSLVQ